MPQGLGIQLGLGGGRSATASGSPAAGGPLANESSVSFDGVNDYLYNNDITSAFDVGTGAFSVSVWVYPREQADVQFILSTRKGAAAVPGGSTTYWQNEAGMYLQWDGGYAAPQGRFRGATRSYASNSGPFNYFSSDTKYDENEWYHIVFVRTGVGDNTTVNVNKVLQSPYGGDGSSKNIESAATDITRYDNGLGVGSGVQFAHSTSAGFNTNPLDCLIDEVALFTTALSQDDVTAIFDATSTGKTSNLADYSPALWWRMGDGTEGESGTTIYDMSANSNNGTLTNGPTYSSTVPS